MDTSAINSEVTESVKGIENAEKEKLEKRRKMGVILVVIGSFLCVFGFLITMFLLQHEVNFNVALYGTTGLGGMMLLGGMIAIMG